MKGNITVRPNEFTEEQRLLFESDKYMTYTGAYIGAYTYCIDLHIDNGMEFTAEKNRIQYNLQIGKFNSIGANLECIFGRNHNYKTISTGGVELLLKDRNVIRENSCNVNNYNQKGSILIQNDVWFGENVTLMPGIVVRNGAVIARNSHVVSDVPPYAIVGGNPAKIIGYRYNAEQIDMLEMISWWDWDVEKIIKNAMYFTEDVDRFCNAFYDGAKKEFMEYISDRKIESDTYFVFVDYYENYSDFAYVLESFLGKYINDDNKKCILFCLDEWGENIDESLYCNLMEIAEEIANDLTIKCSIEVRRGGLDEAKKVFLNCSHYIVLRTYNAVYFSCLADKLGIEIISGCDSIIQFEKQGELKNYVR